VADATTAPVRRETVLDKSTIGPSRLSVRDNQARTNNAVESVHAALRQRVKVPHPNLFANFAFLRHVQKANLSKTVSRMSAEFPAACQ